MVVTVVREDFGAWHQKKVAMTIAPVIFTSLLAIHWLFGACQLDFSQIGGARETCTTKRELHDMTLYIVSVSFIFI